MEADLARYYSVNLTDLWHGRLTFRRLWVLLKHLPSESWTQTALRDDTEAELLDLAPVERERPQAHGPWALTNYQLAGLKDEIAHLRYVVARTAGQDNYPLPAPTPRPGLHRQVRRQSAAAVAYLKKLRGKE